MSSRPTQNLIQHKIRYSRIKFLCGVLQTRFLINTHNEPYVCQAANNQIYVAYNEVGLLIFYTTQCIVPYSKSRKNGTEFFITTDAMEVVISH